MSLDLGLYTRVRDQVIAALEPLDGLVGLRPQGTASVLAKTLVVAVTGSRFERPRDRYQSSEQRAELQVQCTIRFRDLRSPDDALAVLRGAELLLTGLQPDACAGGRIYPISSRLSPRDDDGFWSIDLLVGWPFDHSEVEGGF